MRTRRRALACAVATVMGATSPAWAERPRCDGSRPIVHASVDEGVAIDRDRLLRLLRIELESRGLDLCDPSDRKPIAVLRLAAHEGDVTLTVEARDRITAKELKRDVPVGNYPEDARPLLVAVAMDELLRASWAELVLKDAPAPAEPPPKAVTDVVADVARPAQARPLRARVGASAAIDHFAQGATLLGGDLAFGIWITSRFALSLRLGLRGAFSSDSASGSVSPSMIAGGAAASFTITPPTAIAGLDATASVSVARVSFGATANEGARATPQSEGTVLIDGGAEGWLLLGRWVRLTATLLYVQPLRPVRALDGNAVVVGVGGPGIGGGLGACATF